jgi:outer membrane protein insertion porin family
MLQTQQSLYNIGVFDRVRVSPQNPESAAPFQNVVVRLDEAQRYTVRYGIGYQERERVRGTIQLSDLNIFGIGKRADLNLRVSSVEQLAALSFQQPQFRYLPVDSYFNLSAQRQVQVSYDVKRYNISYQLGRPLSSHSWALLRYNFRNVHVYNSQVEPLREDTPRNLSTLSAIYINDTRDNYLDPEKGFFTSTSFGVTTRWLGSNNYLSLFSQTSYYRPLRASLSIAASLRVGLSHPYGRDTDLPISERFFAGGASSLRGFDTDTAGPLDPDTHAPTGGNALLIGNLELRTPPWRFVRLAGFYDTGNVYRYIHDFDISGVSHTVGLGLRIKTPFGPLRADYGFNLNLPAQLRDQGQKAGHFFITIGPPF